MRILRNLFLALIFIVIIVALAAGGGVWYINKYVHSPEFAEQVKAQATKLAGVPVNFKSINWDMAEGLTIDGIDIHNDVPNEQSGILQAKEVRLKYNWRALLNRQFEITEFDIIEPAILIGQKPDGGYRLPIILNEATKTAQLQNQAAAVHPQTTGSQPRLVLVVETCKVEKGHLEIKHSDGSYNLLCNDINGTAKNTNPGGDTLSLQGNVSIAETIISGKVKVTSIHTPFTYKGGSLNLSALEADAYKGKVNGTFEANLFDPKIAYSLKLDFQSIDVNDLLGSAFQKPGVVSGKLDAKTMWLGNASDPMGVSGKGTLEVRNGQIINMPAFKNLAQTLGNMQAIAQPDFSECKAEYTVGEQTMNVQTLVLKSALFDLTGKGKIKFDTSVDMPMEAGLNPELTKQVPQVMVGFLAQRQDGYKTVPFNVTGTLEQPKVDVAIKQENIVNGAQGLLQQYLSPQNNNGQQSNNSQPQQQQQTNGGNNTLKQAEGMLQGLFKKNGSQQPANPAPAAAQQQPQNQPPAQQ